MESFINHYNRTGTDPGFQVGGPEISKKKISNMQPYGINKLSTKTNTQKSLFLNILRYIIYQQKQKIRNTIIS